MMTQEEWDDRMEGLSVALNDVSAIDAVGLLTMMLVRLIGTAPPELQHALSMRVAAVMIGPAPEIEEMH